MVDKNIMDYSLLLGIAETISKKFVEELENNHNYRIIYSVDKTKVYFLTIIDLFQRYNFQKRMEHALKCIKPRGNMISAIPPRPYAARFHQFMLSKVLGSNYL